MYILLKWKRVIQPVILSKQQLNTVFVSVSLICGEYYRWENFPKTFNLIIVSIGSRSHAKFHAKWLFHTGIDDCVDNPGRRSNPPKLNNELILFFSIAWNWFHCNYVNRRTTYDIVDRWTQHTKSYGNFTLKETPAHFVIHFQIWKHELISKMASVHLCVPLILSRMFLTKKNELRLLNIIDCIARKYPGDGDCDYNGRLLWSQRNEMNCHIWIGWIGHRNFKQQVVWQRKPTTNLSLNLYCI